jgi:hypothetical protein
VPPVERISIFSLCSAFAKGTMPDLSETLINARRMAAEFSVVIGLSLLMGVVAVDAKPANQI